MKKKEKEAAKKLTRDEVAVHVERHAHAMVMLAKVMAKVNKLVDQVRDKFRVECEELVTKADGHKEIIGAWAAGQKEAGAFDDQRSIEFTHATVGYRLGSWGVRPLRKMSDEEIADALNKEDWGKRYVKMVPALDREALVRDRETLKPEDCERIGFKIDRTDSFYIDLKSEKPAEVAS